MDDGGAEEVVTASLRTEGRDVGDSTRGCAEFVKGGLGIVVSNVKSEGRDVSESTRGCAEFVKGGIAVSDARIGPRSLSEGPGPEVVRCVGLGMGRAGAGRPCSLDDVFPEVAC